MRGFTIVETLVAISVLAVAMIGPFYAVQSALTASYVARDQLIASSLAQEAIEYVRSIRDNNYLAVPTRTWMDGLSSYACYGAAPSQYCTVDTSKGDLHNDSPNHSAFQAHASTNAVPPLYVSATNLYTQDTAGATQSKFKRFVQIRTVGSEGKEVQVTVTITWTTAKVPYTVTITEYIQDWL